MNKIVGPPAEDGPSSKEKAWAVVRLVLGLAQMMGAVAIRYGFIGVMIGAVCGCVVGAIAGLVFGGVEDGLAFGVFFGAVLSGITFAVTGVLWDAGEGTDFLERRSAMGKPAVLFLCTNNAARSQMAEAFLRSKAADHFDAYSAGTEPKQVHPLAIRVMDEIGIDLSGQRSKDLREYLGKLPVRVAIFVCQKAEEKCPITWPGAIVRLEWPLEDPAAAEGPEVQRIARFRAVRDQIDEKITTWLREAAVNR